ncbi:MAG: phosphoglucomutase/phosphomannomutase family protein [Candidatus Omnitrophota bacterium]
MAKIKFGTDGWRAVISDDFTFDNVRIVAQAIADFIKKSRAHAYRRRHIAVGYDTRFLSENYAELIAEVLAGNGIKVILSDRPCPTPSVSFAILKYRLTGGVMVTASHNPAKYNGIKYKDQYGASAGTDLIGAIERNLHKKAVRSLPVDEAKRQRLIKIENIIPVHLKAICGYVDLSLIKRRAMKILVDSMHGSGGDYIETTLRGGRISATTIRANRETTFGGGSPEPKLPNLRELVARMKKRKYDVGFAADGDADRLAMVLPNGKLITGHKIMTMLLLHLVQDRSMKGDVVQTICGTVLIDKICEKFGLKMHETPVGFKYIAEILVKKKALIGGEETGGIGFKGYLPERDSIMTAMLILEMAAMRRMTIPAILRSIDREFGTYEYRRMDVKYPNNKKKALMERLKKNPFKKVLGKKVVATEDYDGHKFMCEDESWLLLRLSGTEPILRIYAEASTEKKSLAMLNFGKKVAYSI